MKILVIGGTGLIGSNLVQQLLKKGHTVIAGSPSSGVNTITGEGLAEAMKGTEVVVDVSNSPSFEDDAVMSFFKTSTINQMEAESYAGVKHHVMMSIVGADRLPDSGYLRAKVAQEEIVRLSGIPYTILRSTQFYEFAGRIAQAATVDNKVHISTAAFQPIASEEVVEALADVVTSEAVNGIAEVGGPEQMPMSEFIRYYLNTTEDPRQLIEDPGAKYFGTVLNDDSLVPGSNARLGNIKYESWCKTQLIAS